jgi:hypothetical protein
MRLQRRPLTRDNVERKFAETLCAAKGRCCQAQGAPLSDLLMMACLGDAPLVFGRAGASPAVDEFNPDIAQKCLQAAAGYDCKNGNEIALVCRLVFSRQGAIGSSCSSSGTCKQAPGAHAVCDDSGMCVAATLFQGVGASCAHDDLECDLASGIWCNRGTCVGPLQAGDACMYPVSVCPAGTYCSSFSPEMCLPQKALGASCTEFDSCQPPASCRSGICTAPVDGACLAVDPI